MRPLHAFLPLLPNEQAAGITAKSPSKLGYDLLSTLDFPAIALPEESAYLAMSLLRALLLAQSAQV